MIVALLDRHTDNDPLNFTDPLGLCRAGDGDLQTVTVYEPVPVGVVGPPAPVMVPVGTCGGGECLPGSDPEAAAIGLAGSIAGATAGSLSEHGITNVPVRGTWPPETTPIFKPPFTGLYTDGGSAQRFSTATKTLAGAGIALEGIVITANAVDAYRDCGAWAAADSVASDVLVVSTSTIGAAEGAALAAAGCVATGVGATVVWLCGLGGGIAGGVLGTAAGQKIEAWLHSEGITRQNFESGLGRIGSWFDPTG